MIKPRRIEPGPGQESVWDYPRPPRLEPTSKHIQVFFNGTLIAETRRGQRVLETSHPPTYYVPIEDVRMEHLEPVSRTTFCEWKGAASYYTVVVGDQRAERAAWRYPEPTPQFASLRDCVTFYPAQMEACYVDGELVQPQPGNFYGGWVTSDVVGPFKGEPGTMGW
jgi:uncharacterized protein (DUF427 family)